MILTTVLSNIDIAMLILWAIIAVVAIIIEIETISLVSIWFTLGSIVSIVAVLLGAKEWLQFIIFVGVSGVMLLLTRPFVKKISDNQTVPTNVDRFVGKVAVVTKKVLAGEKGEIKIDFQTWPAVGLKEKDYNVGDKVIIKEIIGNKFIIDDIEEIEIK